MEVNAFASILYASTLRVIQPARVQDVFLHIPGIWGAQGDKVSKEAIYQVHEFFRSEALVVPVKRGSYILSAKGLAAANAMMKPRKFDNLRLFLMKKERRVYRKSAGWYE